MRRGGEEGYAPEFHTRKPAKLGGILTSLVALLLGCHLLVRVHWVGGTYRFIAVLKAEAAGTEGKLPKGHFVALESSALPSRELSLWFWRCFLQCFFHAIS